MSLLPRDEARASVAEAVLLPVVDAHGHSGSIA